MPRSTSASGGRSPGSSTETSYVAPALTAALPRPLHLGPRIADLLAPRAVDDLRTRASALGLNPTARKHDLVAAIADFYRDGDAVRALYAAAPSAQRERLAEAAWRGPALDYGGSFFYTGRPDPAIAWLLTHGLVIADWQQIVVPREVALAIRGDDWHPTLTPRPDVETTVGVSIDVVDEDAAAAAALATEHMTLVVDACEVAPPTLLKTGGVGVRDLRRIAKATALPEPAVRLWLTLALDVGLIDVEDDGLVPTPGYDAWLAEPPAQRLALLVDAWWDLRTVPTLVDRPDDSPPRPVLADDAYATVAADLRGDLLSAATAIPAGRAAADGLGLAAAVEWRRPAMARLLTDVRYAVAALWVEAHLLGVAARGTLSTLGRAALGDAADDVAIEPLPPEAPLRLTDAAERLARIADVATQMLPEHTHDAIFQADLTVVVTGTPAADLAGLLDGSADRESRGGAATWRFSADSVRRALDAGHTGETLTAALRAVADHRAVAATARISDRRCGPAPRRDPGPGAGLRAPGRRSGAAGRTCRGTNAARPATDRARAERPRQRTGCHRDTACSSIGRVRPDRRGSGRPTAGRTDHETAGRRAGDRDPDPVTPADAERRRSVRPRRRPDVRAGAGGAGATDAAAGAGSVDRVDVDAGRPLREPTARSPSASCCVTPSTRRGRSPSPTRTGPVRSASG